MAILFVLSMILLFVPRIHSDGRGYYAYIRSLAIDHDLDFINEYTVYTDDPSGLPDVNHRTATGLVQNVWSVGPAILWIPFFYAAHLGTYILNLLGFAIPRDGYSLLYTLAASFGSAFYAFLGILLVYDLCVSYFGFSRAASMLATVSVWFASPLTMYMYREPAMGHTFAFFAVSLFLYLFFFTKENRTRPANGGATLQWIWLGLSAGLMVLVRWQDVAFLSIPAIYFIVEGVKWARERAWGRLRELVSHWGIFLATVAFLFLPQMIVWKIIYGVYLLNPHKFVIPLGGEKFMLWESPSILGVLFSMRHGLFTWTPVLLLALPGFYYLYKRDRVIAIALLVALGLQVYINASAIDWWSSVSFGQRRMIETLPIFVFGLAALIDRLKTRLSLAIASGVGVLFVVWNLLFLVQYCRLLIPSCAPITFHQLAVEKFQLPLREIALFFFAKFIKDIPSSYGFSPGHFYLSLTLRIVGLGLLSVFTALLGVYAHSKLRGWVKVKGA